MNETALKMAKSMYTSSMNDWLKGETPFATSGKLKKHHEEIHENVARFLTNQLKGPKEFKEPYLTQLKQVLLYL